MRNWILAARIRTLPAALAPVLVGAVLAHLNGAFNWIATALACLCALLIQVGTNLANDYFDWKNGADTDRRLGPTRVTQSGLIAPQRVKRAMIASFSLAALVGAGLIARAGWPIAVIGMISIAMGVLYTGGPKPFGYLGLGDIVSFVFFGPIATAGTEFVNTLHLDKTAIVLGSALGLMTAAILAVNNLRDIDEDRSTGKATIAVRFGPTVVRMEYSACLLGASAIVGGWSYQSGRLWGIVVAGVVAAASIRLIGIFWKREGRDLDPLLGQTARLLLALSFGVCTAWIVG